METVQNSSGLGSMVIYTFRAGSTLGSMAINTLRSGSLAERIVLGTALLATGTFIATKIIQMVARFFMEPPRSNSVPKYQLQLRKETVDDLHKRVKEQYFPTKIEVSKVSEETKDQVSKLPSHSLLDSLILNDLVVTQDLEVPLALALHGYHELKTKIGGNEDRFIFLAMSFLQSGNEGLPSVIEWEEKGLDLDIPPHGNKMFAELENKLNIVGLSLKNLERSEEPIAVVQFKDETSKKIYSLADLYQTIKLHGPHILSRFEVELKKPLVVKAKIQLHESRMSIIDKTLSTVRAVLIEDFVAKFGDKNKELYPIFGSNRETLLFVLENICWHALDRVFETLETTFIPSKESEQKTRKIDLETQLGKVLTEEAKLKQAQMYLQQILEKPDNNKAMGSLVKLLLEEVENSSERDSLVIKLQTPELQSQEKSIELELERLDGVQRFYDKVTMGAALADEGKKALLRGNGEKDNQAEFGARRRSSPMPEIDSTADNRWTYAKQIDELSIEIVKASSMAVGEVADLKWHEFLLSLDEELKNVPNLSSELCVAIIEQGWVNFNQRQALLFLTGEHRWLITKKMIVQRLAQGSLQDKGKALLKEVGKKGANLFKTLYGRFVTALLAFDQRTRGTNVERCKPADRIVETFIDAVLDCHQALAQVQEKGSDEIGNREESVVKELEDSVGIHPSAENKPSADAVFLGALLFRFLSILQPEVLTEDIRDALTKSLVSAGEAEPTLLRDVIEKYKTIRPTMDPWVKPLGAFLVPFLQFIIERQSSHNFANQLSDLLSPMALNALIIEFLRDDDSEIKIENGFLGNKDRAKWYQEDERLFQEGLEKRSLLDKEIKVMENSFEEHKKEASVTSKKDSSKALEFFAKKLGSLKEELGKLDLELAPEMLRRIVIANVPSLFVGYVVQFADDLFELMQYPRILRHIVFNVLEKSVHSLAKPLQKSAENLLHLPVNHEFEEQSAFDFFFSNRLKTNIGNKIGTLFSRISATENQYSYFVGFSQKVAKWVFPGYTVFTAIQGLIEKLIKINFKSDEAVNWSASKVVVTLNNRILESAQDLTDSGVKAIIATQLKKVIGIKEVGSEKDPVLNASLL